MTIWDQEWIPIITKRLIDCFGREKWRQLETIGDNMKMLVIALGLIMSMLIGCARIWSESDGSPDRNARILAAALHEVLSAREYGRRVILVVTVSGSTVDRVLDNLPEKAPLVEFRISDAGIELQGLSLKDKATGVPAETVSLSLVEAGPASAEVAVSWYAGKIAAYGKVCRMRFSGGKWNVVSQKYGFTS